MECEKCGLSSFPKWKSGETYLGLDSHHNPPEEISKYLNEEWIGQKINLCRLCHQDLHKEITKILNNNSTSLKFINSDFWIMKRMTKEIIIKSQKEIYNFTLDWIKNKRGNNGANNI